MMGILQRGGIFLGGLYGGGKDIELMPILIISYTHLYYIYFPHNCDNNDEIPGNQDHNLERCVKNI